MVSIIVVAHGEIASSIFDVAKKIMPDFSNDIQVVNDCEKTQNLESNILEAFANVEQDEVLVLTDLCGATPDNFVKRLLKNYDIAIISGLSLPMLLKALNYRDKPLNELVKVVCASASQSVNLCIGGSE
jgi:mannose/fructose-specific phosphotransferase system component IIA